MNIYRPEPLSPAWVFPLARPPSEIGPTQVKSGSSVLLVESDTITLETLGGNWKRLPSSDIVIEAEPLDMLELGQVSNKKIYDVKRSPLREPILPVLRSSPTLAPPSILIEEDLTPSSPVWRKEMSPSLWLPTGTVSADSALKWSRGSCERTLRNSWFSVNKIEALKDGVDQPMKNLPMIYSTLITTLPLNKGKPEPLGKEGVLRIRKYRLYLNKQTIKTLKEWFHITRWIYNQCVGWLSLNPGVKPNLTLLKHHTINSKSTNQNSQVKEWLCRVPYNVKDGTIRDFLTAFTTQSKMIKEGKRKFFEMKYRTKKELDRYLASMVFHHIDFRSIKNRGNKTYITCFPNFLPQESLITREKITHVNHDTRITWNGRDTFMLHIPTDIVINQKVRVPKYNVVALDPGEKVFMTAYGSDEEAYLIGQNGSKKVDKLATIASRMRNGIKRVLQPDGTKTFESAKSRRTRKNLILKARDLEWRAKNLISDIHNKTVKFLTDKYDTIIIPEFRTQQMVTKRNEEGRWKRKIGKDTTRRLIRWSHYRFRELLKAKGASCGVKVVVGTEEYTSKTCGNCFNLNYGLGGSRAFICPTCGCAMHRDVNAARNILMLNWDRARLNI